MVVVVVVERSVTVGASASSTTVRKVNKQVNKQAATSVTSPRGASPLTTTLRTASRSSVPPRCSHLRSQAAHYCLIICVLRGGPIARRSLSVLTRYCNARVTSEGNLARARYGPCHVLHMYDHVGFVFLCYLGRSGPGKFKVVIERIRLLL